MHVRPPATLVSSLPAIGVDVGGTKLAAGLVGKAGDLRARSERPTPVSSQEALLAALDEVVEELLAQGPVAAIGLGIPSTIDQRTGQVVASVHIPLGGLDLRTRVRERFGIPVAVDNDGNAAALAEWAIGAGRGSQHMIMITLGTGIGGGLILGGRPYRGAVGAGAELGHMVIQVDGPPCEGSCRGRGHFEALASGRAANARAHELGLADAHALVEAAAAGDKPARDALTQLGRMLGAGLGGLVNIFNPELIVIGGGFGAAGDLLFDPAREALAREALAPGRDVVRIVPAALGPRAGLVGAGLIAFEMLEGAADGA